jgi:predicted transcriptional regulator
MTYPGVSFGVIRRLFNLKTSTLRYHLNYLENRNEIVSSVEGRKRCYYPVLNYIFDSRDDSDVRMYQLTDTQEHLLGLIQRYPDITQKELKYRSRLKSFTLKYNLERLIDIGVVQKTKNGRTTYYNYITEDELKEKIMDRLIVKLLNHEIDEYTFIALKRKLEM